MPSSISTFILKRILNQSFISAFLLGLSSIASFIIVVTPLAVRPSSFPLALGDVSTQDILAPNELSYISEILTEQIKQETENKVARIYLNIDPSISRRQIEQLKVALNYISTIRQDTYSTMDEKLADLGSLTNAQLKPVTKTQILHFNDEIWLKIQKEGLYVLEQTMRETIRDINLPDVEKNVIARIDLSFDKEQAQVIQSLVTPFISPNSLYSDELTSAARSQARFSIEPVVRDFAAGESIIRRGQIVSPIVLEALEKFNLITPHQKPSDLISTGLMVLLLSTFIGLFFARRKTIQPFIKNKNLLVVSVIFLAFLFCARLVIPNRVVLPYLFPLPAFGLTIASIFSLEIGLITSLALGILAAFGLHNSLDLTIFYVFSGICGIFLLEKWRRISSFLWAGLAMGGVGSTVILAYRITDTTLDWVGIITLIGGSLFNGIASTTITLLLQYVFSQILGMTTPLQLMELSRPDHPLLQFLLRNAPGTYQHSLQVANLAEQAAEAIGADALLTRVGAIYHDVGKALNPTFFIENQVPGKLNPHDDLDPVACATIILRHISDGLLLARKFHLPSRIRDFITEHHGTSITRYQYSHAVEKNANTPEMVNIENYKYPGPPPRSRETALLMLADSCEAKARAELPKDETSLQASIGKVFELCQKDGQLDNSNLTLDDLFIIKDTFVSILKNLYHPRLQYPTTNQ
jgi:putative nucleotidyltransferase with HDIG domain